MQQTLLVLFKEPRGQEYEFDSMFPVEIVSVSQSNFLILGNAGMMGSGKHNVQTLLDVVTLPGSNGLLDLHNDPGVGALRRKGTVGAIMVMLQQFLGKLCILIQVLVSQIPVVDFLGDAAADHGNTGNQ